jgi:hypothetical protein
MKIKIRFLSYLPLFFIKLEMFRTKVVEKFRTHILCSITFSFFFENRVVYEKNWKIILERGRPQMRIWGMRIACWITKATITHAQAV